ncbi:sugar phosphate isomerase/epimerase [Anaerobacterium chartisolvens]|uniref:Sugar phosphate isomerase/epimerase n=1 Tax=Anaerobacterium chartisolvens TaxID=1297424 RepID=A0A369B697_9FIRM|nr:TIM barrel protein [Anaerobacterium chartisolvens]RCX16057.1 sugar phosphate isomerase/epimerase [Anaerobacterium chartisolvens]
MSIKRGVSFYSYQQAYYKGIYNLEDLIRITSQEAGAEGIEIVAEQTPVGSYPNPSDADVDRWFGWMDKYKTKLACMDSFIDYLMFKGRVCTLKEQVQMMERDLRLAAKLGFPVIRVLCPVRKEVVEASIPIAEYCNVRMGLEVHSPMMIHARWIEEYVDMYERSGSKHVGIIPDFGIFQKRPARKMIQDALKRGADEKTLMYISEAFESGTDINKIIQQLKQSNAGPNEMQVAMSLIRTRRSKPEDLKDIAKYIFHVHGKFYDMDENCNETCIDYETPFKVLKEIGYEGYISSEFEGQGLYKGEEEADELEQVKRHQVMLKRLIGE